MKADGLAEAVDLLPVPMGSLTSIFLKISDLLVGRGRDKFPEYDARLLLLAAWRKHAGKTYYMRWGNQGEIEISIGNVMKIRLERMQDGLRLRILRM